MGREERQGQRWVEGFFFKIEEILVHSMLKVKELVEIGRAHV